MNRHVAADDNDLLDLVNERDEVIGTILQADAHTLIDTKLGFVRGVAALVQNDQGELWVPRRSPTKRVSPGGLDFSVAEHVQSGETYEEAIVRGFKEELFTDIGGSALTFLGKLEPLPELPYFFMCMYLHHANEVPEYNHGDYTGYEWLLPEDLLSRIKSGEPAKTAITPTIERFLLS